MKQYSKKAKRDPILMNVSNLAETVIKTQAKNMSKYDQIKSLNPDFDFKLYKPSIPSYEIREELGLAQDIMLRQIDRLMEDEEKLNIQLDKHHIKIKQHQRKIEKQIMLSMDHFTFLRKLWKKQQFMQSTDDKVDKLIHNVGSIKGHILNLIKKENELNVSPPEIRELVISSPQYCDLVKKYEQLKSYFQSIQEKQENTNFSSDNSIESEQSKKQQALFEEEIHRLKQELSYKNKQLQKMKFFSQKRKQNQNCFPKKNRYSVVSSDGSFTIYIEQIQKRYTQIQESLNQSQMKESVKQIISKQSLQSILKYIQTGQIRKTTSKSAIQIEAQSRPRKFTVEQITRAKFISNRQIVTGKAPQINPVT